LRGLLGALPSGTVPVGTGLVVLGAASYVHLAFAGHVLDHADMSSLAVLWALVYAIGLGLFFPVEQEITRLVAARRLQGGGAGPVLRRGALLAGAMLAALLVVVLVASGLLADRLFDGRTSLVWAFVGALLGLAVAHTTRGVFAGRGQFRWYGLQLGIDGGLRMVFAAVLGVAGVDSPFWFSFLLTAAPLLSVLMTLPGLVPETGPGPEVGWAELVRGLGLLTVSALAAQLVVNIAVINVRLLEPSDVTAAAAMLSAVVLVRIPLFVFASLQASLLPGLTTAVTAGRRVEYRHLLLRALAVVTLLGVVGGVIAIVVGPPLAVALFDAPDVLGASDYAWLAAGTLGYLWALVLGQGVLALGRHRDQAVAWVIGTVVLIAVTLTPTSVAFRVELAFAAGSLVVAGVMALMLGGGRLGRNSKWPAMVAPATVSAVDIG
jgi:O-antigen/teichoic acid export membrane protein